MVPTAPLCIGVLHENPCAEEQRNTSIDRILFSVDYPFTSNWGGKRWMEELVGRGLVGEEGVMKIAYRNAEGSRGVKAS